MEDSRHVQSYCIHPSNTRLEKYLNMLLKSNSEHENINKYPKPVAFDVSLNNDISSIERKPFPRRLEVSLILVYVSPFVDTLLILCCTIHIVIFTLETRE